MALNIFKDIHKRKVFRVATVYSVAAWLLMQVLDIVLPTFNAPQWVNQTLLLLLLLGLPLVTIIAWVMEDKNTHVGTEQNVALRLVSFLFLLFFYLVIDSFFQVTHDLKIATPVIQIYPLEFSEAL